MTIGDGVVTSVKYEGAGGNVVRIKHNSVYSTAYLHLSKYAKGLKAGQRVKQGDVIGYVGSTGRSTGPHLDFRVWKNGTPINPLTMDSPPAEPIKKESIPAFEAAIVEYQDMIEKVAVIEDAKELFGLL
jgi:murein DD-endopeptidase MepM/ murein hydrolase activator NlpD